MNIQETLRKYEDVLRDGQTLQFYLANACYDRCAHCYMNTVPETSSKARFVDKEDMFHFVDLMRQGERINLSISGGDPLLHPDIVDILDHFSGVASMDILTSGFALSDRNTSNRKELLEALVRNGTSCTVASPDEQYHSITWKDYNDIKKYIKEQGFNPGKLGYASRSGEIIQKVLLALNPIGLAVMTAAFLINKLGGNELPPVLPIGRAKNLPKEQPRDTTSNRSSKIFDPVTVSYKGDLQYGFYCCHDGFMNIRELRDVDDKEEAIKMILERLGKDRTFQDMVKHDKWYFSDKVRKKAEVA
jgi:hypothetical protein